MRSVLLDVQVQIAARRRGYDAARARPAVRALRAGGRLGHDAAHAAVDAHDARRAGLRGLDGGRPRRAVLATTSRWRRRATWTRSRDGDVPLEFLFSGSVFYTGGDGELQTTRLSWESEADYALPVRVWKETMERYFRGTAWVRLSKESFDRLSAYKSRNALATWDDALEALGPMSELRTLADAVMYEGYMLWPYTPSALKNQRRWTFGCVFPPAWTRCIPTTRR